MHFAQVSDQFAQRSASERLAKLDRAGGGRRDDDVFSSSLSWRGRPPAHRGARQARPFSLNAWIASRTVSSSACTSWATTSTRFPPAEASQHHRPPAANRTGAAPTHDLLQLLPLLVGQSAHTDGLGHPASSGRIGRHRTSNRYNRRAGEPMRSQH